MSSLAKQVVTYLKDLGLPATQVHFIQSRGLPYFLTDAFDLAMIMLAGRGVVLAIDQEAGRSPAKIDVLIRRLSEVVTSAQVVYVTSALSSYDRKRLIERSVPFLVPGNQLYLPPLGMDLREHFRKPVMPSQGLSPSAQAILISALRRPQWANEFTGAEVAVVLGYTPMTASRATRELASTGLVEVRTASRRRVLVCKQPAKETWELALPLLRNPIQRVEHVRVSSNAEQRRHELRLAGLAALAKRSMLATEDELVFAVGREEWSARQPSYDVVPQAEPGVTMEVQVWSYSASLEPGSDAVDPLSLYLSLRDSGDPRVQSALEEMMEQLWR